MRLTNPPSPPSPPCLLTLSPHLPQPFASLPPPSPSHPPLPPRPGRSGRASGSVGPSVRIDSGMLFISEPWTVMLVSYLPVYRAAPALPPAAPTAEVYAHSHQRPGPAANLSCRTLPCPLPRLALYPCKVRRVRHPLGHAVPDKDEINR